MAEDKIELTAIKVGLQQADGLNGAPEKALRRQSTISKTTKVVEKSFLVAFIDQLMIMLKRNFILQVRYRSATLSQILLAPFLFHLVLFVLQQEDYALQRVSDYHPPQGQLPGVPPCQGYNGVGCILFMYTPVTAETTGYMTTFAKLNRNRTGNAFSVATSQLTSTTYKPQGADASTIYPVASDDFIYNYALANPNITQWAIRFDTKNAGQPNVNVRYQLWFNGTNSANISDIFGRTMLSVVRGIDEAIITNLNGGSVPSNLDIQMKDWPLIPSTTVSDAIVQGLGPVFFFCSTMVIFINIINQVVGEKEMKLRLGMEMMGLKPSVYWLSHYLSTSSLVLVNALLTSIFGLVFQFTAFKQTNFAILWITFFLFGEAMVMFGFFLTTFVRQARVAVLLGIFIFIIGLLFETFVFGNGSLGYIWYKDDIVSPIAFKILSLFPFYNFGHMFLDITTLTTGHLDQLTQTYIPGPGFPWSQLYNDIPSNLLPKYQSGRPSPPVPVNAWALMIMNVILYAFLLWIFDTIIPNEYGTSYPIWFPFLPSYWGYTSKSKQAEAEWLNKVKQLTANIAAPAADEDHDVTAERAYTVTPGGGEVVKIVNLRKVYKHNIFSASANDKVAVANTCVSLPEGKLLALLGQNGAGKSTTMSILAGLTPATAGDALIYGLSIRNQIGRVRRLLGVCPQHDILFDDLTAREHIELYAGLKGVPKKYWTELFEERLKAVKLWTVKDVQSGTYSGGMKRRLSLLISTIGDPRVIFMDEPTTGMDPVNRRHVWSFIEQFKKDRVIVLTTHSMEEADVLGDRIAIMAHGRLRAIGNSISLKAKFGAGYRISIIASDPDAVKAQVAKMVAKAKLEDDSAGALIYQFPLASTPSIPSFVKWLEENPNGVVKAWGISQTTLEEVFLKLIREANPNGYTATIAQPVA
ncbi:ATP-binding cassette sub- A member 1 [Irineochytrium annulatum]|nr:ATP-binding cassette sub- A member 1 [Irineochytrium annulatum]